MTGLAKCVQLKKKMERKNIPQKAINKQSVPAQKTPGTKLQKMTLRTLLFFLIFSTASNI